MTLHAPVLHALVPNAPVQQALTQPTVTLPHPAPVSAARHARLAARLAVVTLVAAGTVGLPVPDPVSAAQESVRASEPLAAVELPEPNAAPEVPQPAEPAPQPAGSIEAPQPTAGPAAETAQVVVTERLPLAFRTVRREDPARTRGTEAVARAGRAGVLTRTYADLGLAGRVLVAEQRVLEPVDRVVAVGTGARPTYGGLGWASLARCESGGDPRAVSRTGRYRGLYQFSLSTWRSVGGAGDPAAHSRESQTAHAWKLYQRDGRAPWPECGRHL